MLPQEVRPPLKLPEFSRDSSRAAAGGTGFISGVEADSRVPLPAFCCRVSGWLQSFSRSLTHIGDKGMELAFISDSNAVLSLHCLIQTENLGFSRD